MSIYNPPPASGGIPSSPDTSIQYNNGGSFGGTELLYSKSTNFVTVRLIAQSVSNTVGDNLLLFASDGNGTGKGGRLKMAGGFNQGETAFGGTLTLWGANDTAPTLLQGMTSDTISGGDVWLEGGTSYSTTNTDGGNIQIIGGSATTNGIGGSIILLAGANPGGSGTSGNIKLQDPGSLLNAILNTASISSTDKTFTFPNETGIIVATPNPSANTIYVWDNTDGLPKNALIGSGLTYTHSTHTLSASGGGMSIGGAVTSGTTGSVLFVGAGPVLAQDNSNFFWDSTNHRLGIGTTTPSFPVQIIGDYDGNGDGPLILTNKTSTIGTALTLDATAASGTGHQYSLISTGSSSFFGAGTFAFLDNTRLAYCFNIDAIGRINLGDTGNYTTIIPGFAGFTSALPAGTIWDVHQQGFSISSESTSAAVSLAYYNGTTFFSALRYTGVVSGFTNLLLIPDGGTMEIGGIISKYNGITTTGWGVPAIYGSDRKTALTATQALATFTVGASDGSFLVSANVNVTSSTAFSFGVTCTYKDETNTSRVLNLSFSNLAGTFLQTITNVLGAGAYEGIPLHIRAKAGTTIIIASTGTFTTVTYNLEELISQIA